MNAGEYVEYGLRQLQQSRGLWQGKTGLRRLAQRLLLGRLENEAHRLQRLIAEGQVTFGRFSYGQPFIDVSEGETTRVTVGSFCSIARDVQIFVGGNHRMDWVTTFPFRWFFGMEGANQDGHPASKGDVRIGDDVWIGTGATIMSGVTVGSGAVIAARSVVTQNVRPYALVGGVPAREIRRRFPDDQVEALLEIRWWDWPIERILESVPELCAENIDEFIERHGARSPREAPMANGNSHPQPIRVSSI